MEVAKKYEISETNARNIFVNRRANITLLQMRKMAKDVNLEEFFIPADETTDGIEVVGEKDSYVGLVIFWFYMSMNNLTHSPIQYL